MEIEKINTGYLIGEEYGLYLDSKIESLPPYERDNWAIEFLKKLGFKVRSKTYVIFSYHGMKIINTDYKAAAFK